MIRPKRWATIGILIVLGFLTYSLYQPRSHESSRVAPQQSFDISEKSVVLSLAPAVATFAATSYPAEDAHLFTTADQFLPYFQAVWELPNLSTTDAKKTCTWNSNDDVFFTFNGLDRDWIKNDPSEEEIDMRRQEWKTFMKEDLIPYSSVKERFAGRGIVVLAGNGDTLKRLLVLLRSLVQLGSKLPVEVHYWKDEINDGEKNMLAEVYRNILFNDLAAETNIFKTGVGIFINYQLKSAALVNSRFAEPILLDSDNIPVIDPERLYDSDIYREYGTIFWPDIGRTLPQTPVWALTNTECNINEYEQESGQLVVDKRRFFYHLQLAAWMNHQPYWNEFLLGDKDMFRFAWHALKTKYGQPRQWLTSVGIMQDDGMYCGHSFGQYHPDGSLAFLHGGTLKSMEATVIKHWSENGGLFRNFKKSTAETNHTLIVPVGIRFRSGANIPGLEGTRIWSCTDMYKVEASDFNELVPNFDSRFKSAGGFWMLDKLIDSNEDVATGYKLLDGNVGKGQ